MALRRLARPHDPSAILFVCNGNICRSPYAAASFRTHMQRVKGRESIRVMSAGFLEPGRAPPAEALGAAKARGVDLSEHRSRTLAPDLVRDAELMFVMDPRQRRELRARFGCHRRDIVVLGDLDPQAIDRRAIPDPIDRPVEFFVAVYDRIDRCIEQLVAALSEKSSVRSPSS
jgi:protein-tyrosine phosphatase